MTDNDAIDFKPQRCMIGELQLGLPINSLLIQMEG